MLVRVLAWIGGVAAVLLFACTGGVLLLANTGDELDATSKAYALESLHAVVTDWDASALDERAHPELRALLKPDEAQRIVSWLSSLGTLRDVGEPVGEAKVFFDLFTGMRPHTAEYRIPVTFAKGEATITVVLRQHDGEWKLLGFHENSPSLVPAAS